MNIPVYIAVLAVIGGMAIGALVVAPISKILGWAFSLEQPSDKTSMTRFFYLILMPASGIAVGAVAAYFIWH